MKKIRSIICIALALTSCSNEETPSHNGADSGQRFTFDITLEDPAEDAGPAAAKTRGEIAVARYILEMYEGEIEGKLVERKEQSKGSFEVTIKKGEDYMCLFWADNGPEDYNAESLKAVSQSSETNAGRIAYFASRKVNDKNFDANVRLIHAVAEISFVETVGFASTDNILEVHYPFASTQFNVWEGSVTRSAGSCRRRFPAIGAIAADACIATDYLLAPVEKETLKVLKFSLNSSQEKEVAMIPVRANFRTKITGKYTQD